MFRNISDRATIVRCSLICLALLFATSCQNAPRYQKNSGKFNEWRSYNSKAFQPTTGTVLARDPAASTVTIARGHGKTVFTVTPSTRIMHQGDDITLAQLPINESVKYTVDPDGIHLLTIWYGHALGAAAIHQTVVHRDENTFFQ
jgi:hypothetical protein